MKCSVALAAEFGIMVCSVHLLADRPAQRAADQYVAGKMIFARDSGYADGGGQPVAQDLGHHAGILVRENRSRGPRQGGVHGRKPGMESAPLAKFPQARTFIGTGAAR